MRLEPSQINQILMYLLPVVGLLFFAVGIVTLKRFTKPVLTLEQEEQAREEEIEKQIYRVITKEAVDLVKKIPQALAIQNSMKSYTRVKPGPTGKRLKMFRFDVAMVTKTEIWVSFNDWRGFPNGVGYDDLVEQKNRVIDNIQFAIKRQVRWYEDQDHYLFLRVGLKYALQGIPKRVAWSLAYNALPKSKPLAVAIGMTERGTIIHQDIRDWPHMLMAGATQQGKSTQLLQWLITLIKNNSPSHVKFVLVDLKEGVELGIFKNLPHVISFVEEPDQVQSQLDYLLKEYKSRMEKIKAAGVSSVRAYNAISQHKLPYLMLVVDELADLMLDDDTKLKKAANKAFVQLARKGRAAGIHMILCTQIIQAEVVTLQIRGNFPGRLAFAMPGISESTLILNNSLATTLEIPGRCVYRSGAELIVLQAPIATKEEIDQVIIDAAGPQEPQEPPEYDLFRVSIYNLKGFAAERDLWEATEKTWSMNKIRTALKNHTYDWDKAAPVLEIDKKKYILAPGYRSNKGTVARCFVPVNGTIPTWEETKLITGLRNMDNDQILKLSPANGDEEE